MSHSRIAVLLAVAVTALPAQAQAPAATIAFETSALQILLPVRIEGSRTLWFSLDSGAGSMIVDAAIARELGLPLANPSTGSGAGAGPVPYHKIARPLEIEVGNVRSKGHDFIALDLSGVSTNIGRRMDGILGHAFFAEQVVAVDFQRRSVTLFAPGSFQPPAGAAVLPIELVKRVPFIRGEIKVPGVPAESSRFLVDSGSADAVDHPLIMQSKGKVIDTTAGVGLGTPIPGSIGRAEYFKLGPFRLDRPITACCGSNEMNERMIGNEVLRRFHVTFDYPRLRMILEPNSDFDDGFDFDRSGLDLEAAEAGKAFRVRRVTQPSPASEAGIRVDDLIEAIDSVSAARITLPQAGDILMKAGAAPVLTIRRGSSTLKATLKLRALL